MQPLISGADGWLVALAAGGLIAGLVLLARGIPAYRSATHIGDTSPSRISSLAVGEALVTGTVEPAELTLVSALQSAPCVFYRSRIGTDDDDVVSSSLDEERAVGFRIRDETGDLRVFPRGARFDVPDRFSDRDGAMGDRPPGLDLRTGSPFGPGPADREGQIAALLTVQGSGGAALGYGERSMSLSMPSLRIGGGRRSYREARIEPGDVVTVIGRVLPFDQLPDPAVGRRRRGATRSSRTPRSPPTSPRPGPRELSRPTRPRRGATRRSRASGSAGRRGSRSSTPDATQPPLAAAAEAELAERTFAIAPDALVLAAAPDAPLVIALGAPAAAESRHRQAFLVGLLGAVLAIASAMALAILVGGSGFGGPS